MQAEHDYSNTIPQEVSMVAKVLETAGFEAYLIGGCVRDMIIGREPKDWDITTNATPEEIQGLFPHTFYENSYGTVGVVTSEDAPENVKVIEVTPYRKEAAYSDKRRPDSVLFSKKLEDDLERRDFTINAIAYDPFKGHIIDLYKGQEDIVSKMLRTVGKPHDRFNEDALRMLRAIRLSSELGFQIDSETEKGIVDNSHLLALISKERIRDEFTRIVMSDNPKIGLELAHKYNILQFIAADLEAGVGILQGGVHTFDVWEHLLRSVQLTADKAWPLEIRLAALFHDVAKPHTRREGEHKEWTFYGHEVVGARLTKKILTDLKFPQKIVEKVIKLIRWHMFFSDTEQITHSAVRRLIANVGQENIWDLMSVRVADRIGTGRPKESPYRLRKYHSMIEEVMRDPVSVGMLKIDGKGIMDATNAKPGPKVGYILHALLEEVLEKPELNTEEYLSKRAQELNALDEVKLKKLGEKGKEAKSKSEEEQIEEIRKKHFVD